MEKKSKDLDLEPKASGLNKKLKYFKSFPQQLPNRSCCFRISQYQKHFNCAFLKKCQWKSGGISCIINGYEHMFTATKVDNAFKNIEKY